MKKKILTQKPIVVGIALLVGMLHFVIGPRYRGPFRVFVNSYLIDILLPFAMFLLLAFFKHKLMRLRIVRGVLVLGVGVVTETLQFFGVPIFGRTFDPFDYLMFGIGVGAGVLFESKVLSRLPFTGTG
jgi:hypothetical protein